TSRFQSSCVKKLLSVSSMPNWLPGFDRYESLKSPYLFTQLQSKPITLRNAFISGAKNERGVPSGRSRPVPNPYTLPRSEAFTPSSCSVGFTFSFERRRPSLVENL